MRPATLLNTSDLWSLTHAALTQGRWGVARGLLELLARRHDVTDTLSDADAYEQSSGVLLDGEMYAALSYRIGAVNRIAMRALESAGRVIQFRSIANP